MHASKHFASKGFTLIESIMTIAITGILAAAIAVFISRPLIGYNQSASRAVLVDQAETILRRMERDLQKAVPNSVRVNAGGNAIEYFNTIEAIRYRAVTQGSEHALDFSTNSTGFEVIGSFQAAQNNTPYYM